MLAVFPNRELVLYKSWLLRNSLCHIAILIPFLLICHSLHVHFYTSLHRRLLNVGKWNETLGVGSVARWILYELLQTLLLISMNVLLVVFDTANLLEFVLVLLAELKLVESLAEHTFLRNFEWLAWIVSVAISPRPESGACSCCRISISIRTVTVVAATHYLRCYSASHTSLTGKFGVQTNAYATRSLPARHRARATIKIVKLFAQGLSMNFTRVRL